MSQSRLRCLAEILALVALAPVSLEMAVVEAGGLQAGAAAVDITPRNSPPNPPSIVAGGFLEGRADRVHDPLLVRAIVLDDGGGEGRAAVRIALVVVDSCMMPQTLIDEAKTQAAARCGIPIDRMAPVSDPDPIRSFALLAEAYAATRIFVNLPAWSRLLVTKVTEVMACGTMLVTPALDHPSALGNMAQFEDGRHLVYYPPDRPDRLAEILAQYRHAPDERAAIGAAGREEILRAHSLRARLQRMIADAEAGCG
jgi:glycosyltransferase involved in cell wall biosynthesis